MRKRGITPSVSYYSVLQTNATGGSHQVWGYVGLLTTAVDINFEKLAKIPGLSLYASAEWGTGSNLSATLGTVFLVNPNYAIGAYAGEIYMQQQFLKGNLTIAAGRLAANSTFAALPVLDNYVSLAALSPPISILNNDGSYNGPPPGLEWGAQAVYNISAVVQLSAGVFNTNPNSESNGNVFALQQGNKGALVTAQASYLYNQGPKDKGKEGQFTGGFFEDNNSFATLSGSKPTSAGNYGVFLLGQQMVYRPDGPGTSQGMTIWGAWEYSAKDLVSPMPVYTGAGLSYEGLIKQRKNDIVSVAWAYGKTSRFIPSASKANLLEVNYQWVPKPYLHFIPDFQYIWNPKGTNSKASAVFGIQATLTF